MINEQTLIKAFTELLSILVILGLLLLAAAFVKWAWHLLW